MGSGCGDSIVDVTILRPPGNSPSRWHLTRRLLLCSGFTIHDLTGIVKSQFSPDILMRQTKILSHISHGRVLLFPSFPRDKDRTMALLFTREDAQCNARS